MLLTLNNTTFISNTAGVRGGGVNNYVGTMSISNSTFSGNTSGGYGGGISNDAGNGHNRRQHVQWQQANSGGGLQNSGTLNVTNSTISGNRAITTTGGGLYWVTPGSIGVLNTTIVSNTAATQGGNIYAGGSANASITLKNTLIAAGAPNNCDATISSQGRNLESTNTCGLNAVGDKINVNPEVGSAAKQRRRHVDPRAVGRQSGGGCRHQQRLSGCRSARRLTPYRWQS